MIAKLANFPIERAVSLGPLTTLRVGGNCSYLTRISTREQTVEFIDWWLKLAPDARPSVLPLGGGSNILVSDRGFSGLVVKLENEQYEVLDKSEQKVLLRVGAGLQWDRLVALAARSGWGGIECLSGIPGLVGAAPVQNIGAYGQEVSESIVAVEGYDLHTGSPFRFSNAECSFAYRDSVFKRSGVGKYLITAVDIALIPNAEPTIRYADLIRRCEQKKVRGLLDLRELVIEIRRSKSMFYDACDPNHRSAGSFFTNPIVEEGFALKLIEETGMPHYPAGSGRVKLSAAWLIQHSGLEKGFMQRPESRVGLSTNHVLAVINRGGAKASELIELANYVIDTVYDVFGVRLVPEPVFVGF